MRSSSNETLSRADSPLDFTTHLRTATFSRLDHHRGDRRIFILMAGRTHSMIAIGDDEGAGLRQIALHEDDRREGLSLVDLLNVLGHVKFLARQQRKVTGT